MLTHTVLCLSLTSHISAASFNWWHRAKEVRAGWHIGFHDRGRWTFEGYLIALGPLLGYSVGGGHILSKGVEKKPFSGGLVSEILYIFLFFHSVNFPYLSHTYSLTIYRESLSHSLWHVLMSSSFCLFVHLNHPSAALFFQVFSGNQLTFVSFLNQTADFCTRKVNIICYHSTDLLCPANSCPKV